MNRLLGSALLATLIPPLAYNAIILLIAPPTGPVAWLSLAALNVAYFAVVFARSGAPAGKNAAIIGYPLVYLAVVYLGVEFVLTTLILLLPELAESSGKAVLAIQLLLTGTFATIFFVTVSAGRTAGLSTAQAAEERDFMRFAATGLRRFAGRTGDPVVARRARTLEETVRFGGVASSPAVRGLESQILTMLDDLESITDDEEAGRLLIDMERLFADRKDRLRLSQ